MVRAKFTVTEIREYQWGGKRVVLTPQYDTSIPEDQRFAKATPSGSIEMQIDNPPALAYFPIGSVHYIDFTRVDEPKPEKVFA